MSANKWVSTRVQQHKQQGPPGSESQGGAKILEDKAIAEARIKEHGSSPTPETAVPQSKIFECQEATDALSNLAHNADASIYELVGEVKVQPHQTSDAFHEALIKEVEKLGSS